MTLIVLTFRPVQGEAPVTVRATYFRICADATLRGPDNDVAASYCKGLWELCRRQHRSFECSGSFYLRVVNRHGTHQRTGPYEFVKALDGALFTHTDYLGAFAPTRSDFSSPELWREVTFLPAGATSSP